MINLRYHIVSLTAVFLALGLGILAGTTVIDQNVVSGLRSNTNQLENRLNAVKAERDGLQQQLAIWGKFGQAITPPLLAGKLPGRSIVLVADKKVPGSLLDQVSQAIALANARRPTRIVLTDKWRFPGTAQDDLARALGVQVTTRDALIDEAAKQIAARLAGSSDPRAAGDPIRILTDARFIDVGDLPDGTHFPAANAMVVVVASGAKDQMPSQDTFFLPFVRALSSARIVAVAEPLTAVESLAERVRGDRSLVRVVCSVDHVDSVAGRLSLIYALRDLGAGRPARHYGLRGGATAVAPDLGAA